MRILDIQRRLREIGRIRMGEQVPTGNGKMRPSKLELFRFTSKDRTAIEAAATVYGGSSEPWETDDGQQWQLKIEAEEIPVIVPPGDMSFSQSYEQWSKAGCLVRCDGQWDFIGDKACHCDPTARDCKITTRLSVLLPQLPGLGVWRLESHGYYAAVELGGVVDLAAAAAERGQMIPARLRTEKRSVKRFKPDGTPVTHRFVVPVLDLDVHPLSLTSGGPVRALDGAPAGLPAGPGFSPVPPQLEAGPSVAEQVDAVAEDPGPKPRKNAAAPIPATGVRPRTAAEAADQTPAAKAAPAKKAPAKKAAPAKAAPERGGDELPPLPGQEGPRMEPAQFIAMKARDAGVDHHLVVAAVTDTGKTSAKDLTIREARQVINALERIEKGELFIDASTSPPSLVTERPAESSSSEGEGTASQADASTGTDAAPPSDGEPEDVLATLPEVAGEWTPDQWRMLLADRGVKATILIGEAQRWAKEHDEPIPTSLEDLHDRDALCEHLVGFVEETAAKAAG